MVKRCKDCGKQFKVYSTLDKYCFECKPKHFKPINPIGKKTREWMDQREIWLKEDQLDNGKWSCEECGDTISNRSEVEYHHIKTRGSRPDLRLKRDNVMRLCQWCHDKYTPGVMWNEE